MSRDIMGEQAKGRQLRVLVLEPYYGGSHKSFVSGLMRLPFQFELMTLPARKWKWRMRLAAPYFARKLHSMQGRFDRILCSTYVDVAALRGLAPPWVRQTPVLTYFHENQFEYPVQVEDQRDLHFALTNMSTALASDGLAFNSTYNLTTFLDGIRALLRHSGDMRLDDPCEAIRTRARVLPPAVDFSAIDTGDEPDRDGAPVIVWNHRWEHDKDPEAFFEAIYALDSEDIDFRLVVLGQSFKRKPAVFDEARARLSHRILRFGFARSRRDYAGWLRRGDIAVSTARHEFFGLAVLEAVRAGCRPLLPRRLSYPELFPEEFLYGKGQFRQRLRNVVLSGGRLGPELSGRLTDPFSWEALAPAFESWISDATVM
jgi:glycosyltransferase involved in cell wall biosynthesis